MRLYLLLLATIAIGCAGSSGNPPAPIPTAEQTAQTEQTEQTEQAPPPSEPPQATRCLPVVAADCGCVYPCAAGTETAPGGWVFRHPAWRNEPINARIDRWCVEGQCTEAFFGEILCTGICAPRAADSTCHFESGACVGAQAEPVGS
jgi:hypothetical protein